MTYEVEAGTGMEGQRSMHIELHGNGMTPVFMEICCIYMGYLMRLNVLSYNG
jgi:hypothetical protein